MSFIEELKRRNVVRVAIAYAVASWLLLQVIDVLVPILELPNWVAKLVLLLLGIGFVVALIISWAFEMTPEGLKRESEVHREDSIVQHTAKKLDRITIGLLLVVLAVVVLDRFMPETTEPIVVQTIPMGTESPDELQKGQKSEPDTPPVQDERQSVAVIPFVNMSDDQQNEYFSDGISEELLNVLVRIDSLRVPSRTSSFTFKDSDKQLAEIGRALNVKHILEGSVRKAGNKIRVTAQLIEVKTDTHLWSETYTRELDDIFAVQDEIAQAIVSALRQELSGQDQRQLLTHSTRNVEAYNKLLLGRHLWNQRTISGLQAAVAPLREAIELDPEFDQAWVELANTYLAMPEYGAATVAEAIPLAVEAVEKTLELNPDSAMALANLAYYKANYLYDWEEANALFERAIMLEPNLAVLHQWYGTILNTQGRTDEALQQLQIARNLDPLSVIIRHTPGYMSLWAYRLDDAETYLLEALELGQPIRWTFHNLDMLYCMKGDYEEARLYARQLAKMEGFDPAADLARIDALENPDKKEYALELLKLRQDMGDGTFRKALQYALLDEYDLALESLEKGFAAGDSYATAINYMRIYDPLRENPRFQTMLRQMNLLP